MRAAPAKRGFAPFAPCAARRRGFAEAPAGAAGCLVCFRRAKPRARNCRLRHFQAGVVARNQCPWYTGGAKTAERQAKEMTGLGERLQALRRSRGLSQEQLAEQVGVSRQAVSKWELDESVPELEKVVLLSEYFGVTADYLLKGGGGEPSGPAPREKRKPMGQVHFIASAGLLAIGLLLAFGGWYDSQEDSALWGSMIVQVAGVAWYFVGKIVSGQEAPFSIKILDWALGLFMPCAMAAGFLVERRFRPYPTGIKEVGLFLPLYALALWLAYRKLKGGKPKQP